MLKQQLNSPSIFIYYTSKTILSTKAYSMIPYNMYYTYHLNESLIDCLYLFLKLVHNRVTFKTPLNLCMAIYSLTYELTENCK